MVEMNRKRVEEIYDRLPQLVVDLDPNPVGRGPDYIQELIAKTRGYLNEVSVYLQEVLRVKATLESDYETANASFEVSSNDLMANDDRVSRLPAVQDRLAMINVLLSEDYRDLLEKKRKFNDIGHVERAIKHRTKELENTMSAIRLQAQMFKTDIRTGAFYGDDNGKSRGDSWSDPAADIDSDEIEKLMAESEEEQKAEEQQKSEPEGSDEEDDFGEDLDLEVPDQQKVATPEPKKTSKGSKKRSKKEAPVEDLGSSDEDLLLCGECNEPLMEEDGALVCKNGHGKPEPEPEPVEEPESVSEVVEEPEVEEETEEEDADVQAFLDDEDDFSDVLDGLDEV